MKRRLLLTLPGFLVAGFLVAGLAACFSTTQRREESLIREARQFNDDLRWARWDAIVAALPAAEGTLFNARATEVGEELVMADYEVTSITFGASSESATSVCKVEWYLKRDQTVKTSTLEQRWEHREGKWLMIKQRRTRGARFPLVPEALARPDGGAPPDAG